MNKIKIGIVFNYIGMLINILTGILLTPFMIRSLGEAEYGLYQLVVSISGYLMVVNVGTGTAMNRFVSMYRAKGDKKAESNYILINLITTFGLVLLVLMIGFFIRANFSKWFSNVIPSNDYANLAKTLCLFVILNVALNFMENSFEGLVQAYERIDYVKIYQVFKLSTRFIVLFFLLKIGCKSLAIIIADNLLVFIQICYMIFILIKKCGFVFKIHKIMLDKNLFKETIFFSCASLLSSLSGQLNGNIDKTILAYFCSAFEITVYSVAMTFYVMFTSLGVSLNSIFLNKVTSITYTNGNNKELEDLNIKIGRFQNFLIGLCFTGYICLGKDFILLWMGKRYLLTYDYALLLIIPSYFICILGVPEAILEAKNKRLVQAVVMVAVGVINIFLTIVFIKLMGGIGAPLGTLISFMLGRNVFLNYYLYKNLHINVIRILKEVFKGYWIAQILALLIGRWMLSFIHRFFQLNWFVFILEGSLFVLIYVIFMIWIVFNKEEKKKVKSGFLKKYRR